MRVNEIWKDIISLGIIAMLVAFLIIFFHIYGPIIGHSFTPNYNWVQAFSSQFLRGELYPRWLYQSYQGAGSPAFYFYGPVPFWVNAITGMVLCTACSSESSFMIGPSVLLGLASVSCFHFIKTIAGRKIALLSSLLYFFLPYHFIINFWIRNSWGELSAYIFMPLLFLTIKKSPNGNKYLIAAAMAYAGLLFSHLPSALLFSPVILLFAGLEIGWLNGLKKVAFIVLMGVGIAAIYILPALTTQDLINHEYWANFNPVDWLWFSGKYSMTKGGLFLDVVVYSLLFIWINSRMFSAKEIIREKLLLTAMTASAFSLFLMTDLSLLLWEHISLLRKVQFPWRASGILDIAIVIIFALYLKKIRQHRDKSYSYITIIFIYFIGAFILISHQLPGFLLSSKDETVDELLLSGFEPAEYRTTWLAHNYPHLGYRELEEILSETPTALIIEGKGDIVDVQDVGTELIIQLNAEENIRIRMRRFYYPGWYLKTSDRLNEEVTIELSPYYALIEASLPAGDYSVTLARHALPEEYLGAAVTFVSIISCGLILIRKPSNRSK